MYRNLEAEIKHSGSVRREIANHLKITQGTLSLKTVLIHVKCLVICMLL